MKEPIVTRTIKAYNVSYLGVDLNTHEVGTFMATAPARIKDKETMLKYLTQVYNTTTENGGYMAKPVEILSVEQVETLRGMTERTFIEHSYEIKPRKKDDNSEEIEPENHTAG